MAHASRNRRNFLCVLGFFPDGRHCLVTTERTRDAIVAECEVCGDAFDGECPYFRLSQYVAAHMRRTGHGKFIYYAVEVFEAPGRGVLAAAG